MSTIDLIVLGILINQARNAYELVRFIRDKQIDRVLKISEPAVFKSCRRLAQAGCLDGKTIREHGVPDKVVYSINVKGKARFYELMSHYAQEVKPFYLDFNTVLWNIDSLDRDEGRKLLAELQTQLTQLKSWIVTHEEEARPHLSFGPRQIVKQYRMTITTLNQWIDEVVTEYDELHSGKMK